MARSAETITAVVSGSLNGTPFVARVTTSKWCMVSTEFDGEFQGYFIRGNHVPTFARPLVEPFVSNGALSERAVGHATDAFGELLVTLDWLKGHRELLLKALEKQFGMELEDIFRESTKVNGASNIFENHRHRFQAIAEDLRKCSGPLYVQPEVIACFIIKELSNAPR